MIKRTSGLEKYLHPCPYDVRNRKKMKCWNGLSFISFLFQGVVNLDVFVGSDSIFAYAAGEYRLSFTYTFGKKDFFSYDIFAEMIFGKKQRG
jgi:hypothetical protein